MFFPTCWWKCIVICNVQFRGFKHPEEWATYSKAHSLLKLYCLFCIFYYCRNIKITISQLKHNGSRLRKCCHLSTQSSWKKFFNGKPGSTISVKQSFHFNVSLSLPFLFSSPTTSWHQFRPITLARGLSCLKLRIICFLKPGTHATDLKRFKIAH